MGRHLTIAACLATLTAALALTTAIALPTLAGEADARACMDTMLANASAEGYRLRMNDADLLHKGEELSYATVLTKGSEYIVFACADGAIQDLDIYLYDDTGNLVDRDRMSDAQPIVTVTPAWTGTYLVLVKAYRSEAPGNFSLAVMYK
jgi:hypothetical protein